MLASATLNLHYRSLVRNFSTSPPIDTPKARLALIETQLYISVAYPKFGRVNKRPNTEKKFSTFSEF